MSFSSPLFDSTPAPTPTVLSEPLPPTTPVSFRLPKSITIDGGEYTVQVAVDEGDDLVTLTTTMVSDADYYHDAQLTATEARALAYWLLTYANQAKD